MTSMSNGAVTITPDQVLVWETTTDSGNSIHELVGSGIDVTLGDDLTQTGTIRCVFLDEAAAIAAQLAFRAAAVWTLTSPRSIGMQFVRAGQMTLKLHEQTLSAWHLDIGYREVAS